MNLRFAYDHDSIRRSIAIEINNQLVTLNEANECFGDEGAFYVDINKRGIVVCSDGDEGEMFYIGMENRDIETRINRLTEKFKSLFHVI